MPAAQAEPRRAAPQPIRLPEVVLPSAVAPVAAPVVDAPAPVAEPPPAPRRAHRRGGGIHLDHQTVVHQVSGIPAGMARVSLRTPAGLEVSIDGLWAGVTPLRPMTLTEGNHVLELRESAKVVRTLELLVSEGDAATLFVDFD
jgi:hypothetical protein